MKNRELIELSRECEDGFNCLKCRFENDKSCRSTLVVALTDALEEAERGKERAIAALKDLDGCEYCRNNHDDGRACEENDYTCETCKADCVCAGCKDGDKWEFDSGESADGLH